jgi:hypothetical protein
LRSKLLVIIALLSLATVTWHDVSAGAARLFSKGAPVSGISVKKPGAEAFGGDPDSQGSTRTRAAHTPDPTITATDWRQVGGAWNRWGWHWTRCLGRF